MSESNPSTLLQKTADKLKEHIADLLSTGIIALAVLTWHFLGSDKVYGKLVDLLGTKGLVGLIVLLFSVAIYGVIQSVFLGRKLRKIAREKPVLERLVPVADKQYFLHPENGKPVCQYCVSEGILSYLTPTNEVLCCYKCQNLPVWK